MKMSAPTIPPHRQMFLVFKTVEVFFLLLFMLYKNTRKSKKGDA